MKLPTAYLQQRKEKLTAILQLPPKDYVPETFHKLRVEIKKLRAVVALVQAAAPACRIHQQGLNALRIIFKSAGFIRERQLEAAFIQNAPPRTYQNGFALLQLNLMLAEELEKARFFAYLKSSIPQIIRQLLDDLSDCANQLEKARVKCVLQQQNERMRLQLRTCDTTNEWHLLRKQLKAHEYALKSSVYQPLKWNSEQIVQVLDLLGLWQDCEAMKASFGQLLKTHHASCVQEALHLLIRQLDAKQQNIESQIVELNIMNNTKIKR